MFPLYPYSDSTLCTESARYSQFHATIFDFDIKSPDRDAIKRNLFQLDNNTMSPALSCKAELYHVVPYTKMIISIRKPTCLQPRSKGHIPQEVTPQSID